MIPGLCLASDHHQSNVQFVSLTNPQSTNFELPDSNSNSPTNGVIATGQCLAEEHTFIRPEDTIFRTGFHDQNNLLQSINDLPPELLILILDAVLDDTAKVSYYQEGHYLSTLKGLAMVCKTWKSTIQNTPGFWNVIESTVTRDEMHYMLRKAGKRPLIFRHFMTPYSDHDIDPGIGHNASDFFDIASSNMFRCSSLSSLLAMECGQQAARMLESPAPILRDATVVASDCYFPEHIILFDGQAGMLEDLWLSRIPIRWDLGLPPKLRRLKVSYTNAPTRWLPQPWQVVSALSSCSQIEFIDLSGKTMVREPLEWELGVQESTVGLPRLKELKIENMTIAGSAYILSHLSTPPLRILELTERLQVQADPITSLLCFPNRLLQETIRRALSRCEKVALDLEHESVTLEIKGVEGSVYFLLRCPDPDELTRWLAEEFVSELSSVPELKLVVSSALFSSELQNLQNLMESLTNVVRLHCPHVQEGAAWVLVEHLTRPYQINDGWHWHWPGLRDLQLDDAYNWNELALIMFRKRYGTSQEDGGTRVDTPKWSPPPLTSLRLHGMEFLHPETFEEIVNIVGKEALQEDEWVE